jgi:NitT/TauT family transport system substrate-binding protein
MKLVSVARRLAALLCLLALGSFGVTPAGAQNEKIVLGLVTEPSLNYAPHYMALGAGFFKQEGLDVEIISFDGSGTLVPQLSTKRVTIGWVAPDVVIATHQPGRDQLPLKFFYSGSRISPWQFVVLATSKIKSLADLRGKNIGVGSLNFGNVPITKAIFKRMGMEVGKDYQLVPVGAGAGAFQELASGKVDALNLFDAANATLETTGVKIRYLSVPAEFSNVTAHGFITHDDTLKSDSKIMIGFGRAFAKATITCDVNPRACVENYWKMFPNMKPTKGTEEQQMADAIGVTRAAMRKYLAFPAGKHLYGSFREQGLVDLVHALYDGGQISTDKIDVQTLYTNALIPEINKFDVGAVVAAAKKLP